MVGGLYLAAEFAGGVEMAALSGDDDLLETVGGSDGDVEFLTVLVGEFLDKGIGGLGFFGVDHFDIVVIEDLGRVSFDAVGIEDDHEMAFLHTLIVT